MSETVIDKSGWLNLEINGKPVQMPPGSTVMDAAQTLKVFIPHFCYHKKLSLAASCRMCLVQVEKIPKPVPACATPVSEGMKVWTRSEVALAAQQSVMEFLLINHPLDCPVCDQGGECQLQDVAVGYGKGCSQYQEIKRVVPGKDLGPLVSAAEMSRCIQCTRCVRFGDEIAGQMELGLIRRGDRVEIVPFVGETVESELSGNMIDLCPVGALTSKPFRYQARSWELSRRRSVSPHDALGANLIVQLKRNQVVRVQPFENEAINECWLSDRDRFSYEALNSEARLTRPLVKKDGVLIEADWQEALPLAAARLQNIIERDGGEALGVLISPHATLEEAALMSRLARALGCDNIDHRLRQQDFSQDSKNVSWLGMPIADVSQLKAALFVGSFLRHDQPLLTARVRQAARHGAAISSLHSVRADWHLPLLYENVVPPSQLVTALAALVVAAHRETKATQALPAAFNEVTPTEKDTAIVRTLLAAPERAAIFLGSFAQQHEHAALLHALAQRLADDTGAILGVLPEAANSVGLALTGAQPQKGAQKGGLNARTMLEQPRKAYVLLHTEAPFDVAQGSAALTALRQADFVLSLSPFRPAEEGASLNALPDIVLPDIVLPIAPFTETSGTFINMEGRVQSFHGVAPPLGETRPGWQVIAALAGLLDQPFAETTPEAVRASCVPSADSVKARLSNRADTVLQALPKAAQKTVERVAAVPIYQADPLVRRAPSLQRTALAALPKVAMNAALAARLNLIKGGAVRIRQGNHAGENEVTAVLSWICDETLPANTVRFDMAHPLTAGFDVYGEFHLEATP
ncbi:MAG: NADH-quinone oxidoreductase subunit NuoG [Proteobacteria bacterium]|nr:NADH-quinone oxidoreductase subunit NuoG [Pseudomonadota bacterium]MCL2307678.1 NADH-quinone oxidoreductase subunit NuoG [Pseudomonadota bacterium]